MKKSFISAVALLTASFFVTPALAQQAQNAPKQPLLTEETKVVTVGDTSYTWGEIIGQARMVGVPVEQYQPKDIVTMMATRILIAQENKDLLTNDEQAQKQLAFYKTALTFGLFVNQQQKVLVTQEEINSEYKAFLSTFDGTQINARHILLKDEETAKKIIADLEKGADFATLAKEKSTGPSAKNGGDLGWFGLGQMVPPFEKGVLELEKGTFSKTPVKTQFGYHVIYLTDKKVNPAPTLDEMRTELTNAIFGRKMDELMTEKSKSDKIKRLNEDKFPQ